jgi:hypothetical protein
VESIRHRASAEPTERQTLAGTLRGFAMAFRVAGVFAAGLIIVGAIVSLDSAQGVIIAFLVAIGEVAAAWWAATIATALALLLEGEP